MLDFPLTPRSLPRVITAPGIMSGLEDREAGRDFSSLLSESCGGKIVVVASFLPLNCQKDTESGRWHFSFEEDSLLLQLKDGWSPDCQFIYVGSLNADVEPNEQDEIAGELLEKFGCVPTFLPPDLQRRYYHSFCKQYLWPLFHYMLPMSSDYGDRFDRSNWQAYVSANKAFADKVVEVINPECDSVWVHDYHLMVLPTFLRRRFTRVKIGFFLHIPFPSSEIYRTLPVREEVLRGLLNADLLGFHTFNYARHFLSCCGRLLGLNYETKRGYIGLDYLGRMIYVKISPIGIHMKRLESALDHPSCLSKAVGLKYEFRDKRIILGIDDMDIVKGISLKLQAMEQLLRQHLDLRGRVVLVQIIDPERSAGSDVQDTRDEVYTTAERINRAFGFPGYIPVVLIDRSVPFHEKVAYYALAECCIVNAVSDGMNLVPYEYVICRQGAAKLDEALGISPEAPRSSTLVVSEFIGCSPSLSGAIRVNPWDVDAVADALNVALGTPDAEKQLRHEKHYRYVSTHDVAYWAQSFFQDLDRACKDHSTKQCWGLGFGLSFRVLSLSASFRKLSIERILHSYKRTKSRALFFDYDGTLVPNTSISKAPSSEVISLIDTLCRDPRNTVFIVSGRGRQSLSDWFSQCKNLGIAAEHGYFLRWNSEAEWETSRVDKDFSWKKTTDPVMKLYTETTDGSHVETKESALVWHYHYADHDFGSFQAKELQDHLENVLANEPVVVKTGHHIVEVKTQGVTKGMVAEKVLTELAKGGTKPDMVLCIGDDRSDEDMFESISKASLEETEVFACTVGQKPSKARYYLDDPEDVLALLRGLTSQKPC
ncbi:hypothetical protein MLD38_031982 [Melastoma candidum]|uniref:Uncharacterized protein n=1 Tax=Melastoma candidum TaxID=119954 RepID=A0ACB9MQZ2_9MYRT|nr:hypothetical protein MLD38_031982 [Melastoma candidum]